MRKSLQIIILLTSVAACDRNSNLEVRYGPQAENPVTGVIEDVPTTPLRTVIAQTTSGTLPIENHNSIQALNEIQTPNEFVELIFPGASRNNTIAPAIATFKSACLNNSPDVTAIMAEGRRRGFDMKELGPNAAWGFIEEGSEYTSLQINVASSYAYECTITTLASKDVTDSAVRDAFFKEIGLQPPNGKSLNVMLNDTIYKLSHESIKNKNIDVREHVFLLQGN